MFSNLPFLKNFLFQKSRYLEAPKEGFEFLINVLGLNAGFLTVLAIVTITLSFVFEIC